MNARVKAAVATCLHRSGVLAALRHLQQPGDGLALMFHRVLPRQDEHLCYDPHLVMAEDVFDALLAFLAHEYSVVSLAQLVEGGDGSRPRVAITFDDAWEDTYSIAYPLLRSHNLPATVFVCPQLMSQAAQGATLPEERFARIWAHCAQRGKIELLRANLDPYVSDSGSRKQSSDELKKLPLDERLALIEGWEREFAVAPPLRRSLMTWEEARTVARDGITLGSHTLRHCTLTSENESVVIKELAQSRAEIIERTGTTADFLAYPNGAVSSQVAELARGAGYAFAFTTEAGVLTGTTNAWLAPRLAMEDEVVTSAQKKFHKERARMYLQLRK